MEAEQRTAGEASTSGSAEKGAVDKPVVVLVIGKVLSADNSNMQLGEQQQQRQQDGLHLPL